MADFRVEFSGICCHYTGYSGVIKTVLVAAENEPEELRHYAHLEVQAGGVRNAAGLQPLSILPSYTRRGISYDAYRLAGHRIYFEDVTHTGPPTMQGSFNNQVPHLTYVCRTFGSTGIQNFVTPLPQAGLVAAHVEITTGTLNVTETSDPTHFEPVYADPPPPLQPGDDRPLATVVELTLQLPGAALFPLIFVEPFGGTAHELELEPWVSRIRISNLGLAGMQGNEEQDAHHFLLYYKMANPNSGCTAIPIESLDPKKGLGGGCANTQFP